MALSDRGALLRALRGGEGPARRAAAQALGVLREPSAVGALCDALLDRDALLRESACEALLRIGGPAVEPVCRLVGAREREVLTTVIGLGPAVIPHLLEALRGRDLPQARAAAWALGELAIARPTPQLRAALPVLRRGPRLRSGEAGEHWESLYVLVRERIEAATADLESYPLPAAPPGTAPGSFPLPSAADDPAPPSD